MTACITVAVTVGMGEVDSPKYIKEVEGSGVEDGLETRGVKDDPQASRSTKERWRH